MRGMRTNAAAAMLGVSPSTLRTWERRYGFPQPVRSAGGHRHYELGDIEALRSALADTRDASSAVAMVKQRGAGLVSDRRLAEALAAFDEEATNRLLEESLAVRSIERTVGDVLLPAVAGLPSGSAESEFGQRYATGWLAAIKRLSPPVQRSPGVLVLDASMTLSLDGLYAQALELVLRRAGLRTLALSPTLEPARLSRALRALRPSAIVLAGRGLSLDATARVLYAARAARSMPAVFDFRGAIPDTGATTVTRLGEDPVRACERLLAQLDTGSLPAAALA